MTVDCSVKVTVTSYTLHVVTLSTLLVLQNSLRRHALLLYASK